MKYIYLYIKNELVEECLKYGMKLSEFSNKVLTTSDNSTKSGIVAFLSPYDSELYYDDSYTCLKIATANINCYIFNETCIYDKKISDDFFVPIEDYHIGSFEEPCALITSTILPENLFLYNKILDTPILIENSKEYYYKKSINDMLENDIFSNYEIYQLLLLLGNKKNSFNKIDVNDRLKIYVDKISGKKYTKKSSI